MKPSYAILLALAVLPLAANASSIGLNASLYGYLSAYIPNATLQSASYFRTSLGGSAYVIMQLSNGTNRFIVINATRHYSAMMNAANISVVLEPFLADRYFPNQSTLGFLNTSMHAYESQGSAPVADCLTVTGASQYTCTLGNACFSCQAVPVCKGLIDNLGGPGSTNAKPLIGGIANLSQSSAQLDASYAAYFAALKALNTTNAGSAIQTLSDAVSTISSATSALEQNPLFPLPANFSISMFSLCGSYSSANKPWYCTDIGFCADLSFNSTRLSSMQSAVAQLQRSPLSNSGLASISLDSSRIAAGYVIAVISAVQNDTFHAFLNATEPQYNATVAKSLALLSMFGNATLSASLQRLEASFNAVLSAGASQNLTAANITLSLALANASTAYTAAYSVFSPVYSLAQSNNYQLAVDELSYARIPSSLSRLALQQQSINAQISKGISTSQVQATLASLRAVSSGLGLFAPLTLGGVVKTIDSGLYAPLLSSSAPLSANNSAAALYAAAISAAIGAALLAVFYLRTYARLKAKHKLRLNKRAKKAWRVLFIGLAVALVAYVAVTYAAAGGANAFLPVSGFLGAVRASPGTAVVVNGTSQGMLDCAASVQASLHSLGKLAPVITLVNGACASTNSSYSGSCMGSVTASMPVVLLSAGNSSIAYRGLYGHVLYASGAAASGASCPLDVLFSK